MTGDEEEGFSDEDYLHEAFEYDVVEGSDGEEYFPYRVEASDFFDDGRPQLGNSGYIAGVKGRFSEQVRLEKVAEYYGLDIKQALDIMEDYVDFEELAGCEKSMELIAYILVRRRDGVVAGVQFVEDRYFPFERGSEEYQDMVDQMDAARIIE